MISVIPEDIERNFNGCFKVITEDNVYDTFFLDSIIKIDNDYYYCGTKYNPNTQNVKFTKEKILCWYRIIIKLVKK